MSEVSTTITTLEGYLRALEFLKRVERKVDSFNYLLDPGKGKTEVVRVDDGFVYLIDEVRVSTDPLWGVSFRFSLDDKKVVDVKKVHPSLTYEPLKFAFYPITIGYAFRIENGNSVEARVAVEVVYYRVDKTLYEEEIVPVAKKLTGVS